MRGQRIGTTLMRHAERLVAERGHRLVGIGVGVDNHDAERLYRRLGYVFSGHQYTSRYSFVTAEGVPREETEENRFLTRELSA